MSENEHPINPDYVRALHKKIEALEEQNEEHEERIEALELGGGTTTTSASDGWGDRRDQNVLATFEKGDETSIADLMGRYRQVSEIKKKDKLKERAKDLRDLSGQFVKARYGKIVYTAGEHDE